MHPNIFVLVQLDELPEFEGTARFFIENGIRKILRGRFVVYGTSNAVDLQSMIGSCEASRVLVWFLEDIGAWNEAGIDQRVDDVGPRS